MWCFPDLFSCHAVVARHGVTDSVDPDMSHVEPAAGIGEHRENIVLPPPFLLLKEKIHIENIQTNTPEYASAQ